MAVQDPLECRATRLPDVKEDDGRLGAVEWLTGTP